MGRVVVAAAIVRDGRLLVQQRAWPAEVAGRWELPGGGVETGETDRVALVRECAEELGVRVVPGERVGPEVELPGGRILRAYAATLDEPAAVAVNPARDTRDDEPAAVAVNPACDTRDDEPPGAGAFPAPAGGSPDEGGTGPRAVEHSAVRWVARAELEEIDWLDADRLLLPGLRELLGDGVRRRGRGGWSA